MKFLLATFIEIQDPFWWSPLAKQLGIPSGDSFYNKAEIWGTFWRPPLMNIENETPSGDLKQLGIPSSDSFYSELKYEVPSGDLHRNTRSLLAISTTWNHIWRFLFTECYRCRSSCWQGLKTIIFSSCCSRINSMILSSSIILLECAKISSCNDPKKHICNDLWLDAMHAFVPGFET